MDYAINFVKCNQSMYFERIGTENLCIMIFFFKDNWTNCTARIDV